MSRTKALQISPSPSDPALTPSQKRFNTLIREIERARQTLAAWRENSAAYRQAYAEVLQPLQEELFAGHRQWLFALDAALGQRNWSKAERGTLREVLCDSADELLSARDDAEIKALFDKYSEVDYDTEQRDMMLAMKDLTEMVTGLDLGDDKSIGSEEELFARMRQSMHEHLAKEQTQRDTKAHRRQTAAQKRREDEAKQATQSVREVFRKLTSALHPDRETDERQREVKTALMQRVNMAYEANDLLTLLELQLQIEQIDTSHIANASEQRLKHYNKVLSEQLAEIKAELRHTELEFRMEFGLEPGWSLNPNKLGHTLERTSREWRAELAEQRRHLRMLGDVPATKRWLKRCRQQQRSEEDLDFDFDLW